MRLLDQSLNKKFAIGTAAGLIISSLVFLVLFVTLYREQLGQERATAAAQVNRLLQTSLENAMLKRDLEGLANIVERLGHEPGILAVTITSPLGAVRLSTDPALAGGQIPPEEEILRGPSTRLIERGNGVSALRSVNPVRNKAPCQECHGPVAENPINGILYVDFDATPLQTQARTTTLLLMGSGALIVLINLAGGWWFIRRFVVRPLGHLSDVSLRLSQGDLDARASLPGRDELAALGERFNTMAQGLENKIEELREKEQFMQQLVNAIPDGVCVIDSDFRIRLTNATYREQLGIDPAAQVPEHCYAAAHALESPCPETLITCPLKEIQRSSQPLRVVHRHRRFDGGSLDVELYAAPMEVTQRGERRLMVVESVRDLEQQVKVSHEQKLSELGRLAAGVAHEIHNPLAAVRLALHAAEQENAAAEPDREQVLEFLTLVDQEVEKCSEVTERLLKLSVPPPADQELVEVDRVVSDTLKLLHWEAETRKVEIRLELEEAPLRVLATDSELRMVTLNLAQNACHAMPRGGRLTVRCRRGGNRVELSFEDTGVGIDPKDHLRIFEPFFSRRADGVRGTGLGLSITKSIVESHGGTISVDSETGHGSRILVTFPDEDQQEEI